MGIVLKNPAALTATILAAAKMFVLADQTITPPPRNAPPPPPQRTSGIGSSIEQEAIKIKVEAILSNSGAISVPKTGGVVTLDKNMTDKLASALEVPMSGSGAYTVNPHAEVQKDSTLVRLSFRASSKEFPGPINLGYLSFYNQNPPKLQTCVNFKALASGSLSKRAENWLKEPGVSSAISEITKLSGEQRDSLIDNFSRSLGLPSDTLGVVFLSNPKAPKFMFTQPIQPGVATDKPQIEIELTQRSNGWGIRITDRRILDEKMVSSMLRATVLEVGPGKTKPY